MNLLKWHTVEVSLFDFLEASESLRTIHKSHVRPLKNYPRLSFVSF